MQIMMGLIRSKSSDGLDCTLFLLDLKKSQIGSMRVPGSSLCIALQQSENDDYLLPFFVRTDHSKRVFIIIFFIQSMKKVPKPQPYSAINQLLLYLFGGPFCKVYMIILYFIQYLFFVDLYDQLPTSASNRKVLILAILRLLQLLRGIRDRLALVFALFAGQTPQKDNSRLWGDFIVDSEVMLCSISEDNAAIGTAFDFGRSNCHILNYFMPVFVLLVDGGLVESNLSVIISIAIDSLITGPDRCEMILCSLANSATIHVSLDGEVIIDIDNEADPIRPAPKSTHIILLTIINNPLLVIRLRCCKPNHHNNHHTPHHHMNIQQHITTYSLGSTHNHPQITLG